MWVSASSSTLPVNVRQGKASSFRSTGWPRLMNSTSDWSTTITPSSFSASPTMQSTVPSVKVDPRFFLLSALPDQPGSLPAAIASFEGGTFVDGSTTPSRGATSTSSSRSFCFFASCSSTLLSDSSTVPISRPAAGSVNRSRCRLLSRARDCEAFPSRSAIARSRSMLDMRASSCPFFTRSPAFTARLSSRPATVT